MTGRYRLYGDLGSRETIALGSVLRAKGLPADLIEETPSLTMELAARSGHEQGPYLRSPDGFVLGDLHSILNGIERMHPTPALLPTSPVRRVCARLLEDWIEFWIPLWPRRSWGLVGRVGSCLARSGCLLGRTPTRPDWLLAAWLEADVLGEKNARRHLSSVAPGLLGFGSDLFELETHGPAGDADDVIPIALTALLEEMARDYHLYLALNQRALKDRTPRVVMDLGLGKWAFPTRSDCEARRVETSEEIRAMSADEKSAVRSVLEPTGAWHAMLLPDARDSIDLSDPRSL